MADGSAYPLTDEAGALAPGWGAHDVEVLEELVSLGMQLTRSLAHSAALRAERAERDPEAEPVSAADASRMHLDFVRLSRSIRVTLTLKAHALGAPDNPVRLLRGTARGASDDEETLVFFPPCPVDEPGYPASGDREEIADFCDSEVRASLEHAITHPDRDAAEVERLRERVEHWLECEYSPYDLPGFIREIARDLGLGDRMVMSFGADGEPRDWVVARPEDGGAPVVVPDQAPWPERRVRRARGPIPRTQFLQIPGRKSPPPHPDSS